jgi:hypothetical protein
VKTRVVVPSGKALPGNTENDPAAPPATTVRLADTATADAGMPQMPATGNVRVAWATSAGPPVGPLGSRVSRMRHGVTV